MEAKLMKKQTLVPILACIFEILVGILLLINPIGFTTGIIIAAGIVLLVLGVISIVKYFKADAGEAAVHQTLVKGLVALVAGAFCAFKSNWFVVTFPLLTIIYGIVILVTGLGKVQLTVDMLRAKQGRWYFPAINAAVSIICAIVILRSPFTSTTVLWIFTGITLIVEAVLDAVSLIANREKKTGAEA